MANEPHPVIEMVEKTLESLIQKGDFKNFYILQQSLTENIFTPQELPRLKAVAESLLKTARKDKLMEGLLRVLHGDDTASMQNVTAAAHAVGAQPISSDMQMEHNPFVIKEMIRQKEEEVCRRLRNADKQNTGIQNCAQDQRDYFGKLR